MSEWGDNQVQDPGSGETGVSPADESGSYYPTDETGSSYPTDETGGYSSGYGDNSGSS